MYANSRRHWGSVIATVFHIFLVVGMSVACSWPFPGSTVSVDVTVEDYGHSAWSVLHPSWTATVYGSGSCNANQPMADGSVRLDLEADRPAIVLARPSVGRAQLKPFGGIFPRDVHEGRMTLSALGGYEASLALALSVHGVDWECFDTARLAAEACARLKDPWLLSPESLVDDIADGRFSAVVLRPPHRIPVLVPSLTTVLAPDSPFGVALVPDASGPPRTELPPGIWCYVSPKGRLVVRVTMAAEALWFWLPF